MALGRPVKMLNQKKQIPDPLFLLARAVLLTCLETSLLEFLFMALYVSITLSLLACFFISVKGLIFKILPWRKQNKLTKKALTEYLEDVNFGPAYSTSSWKTRVFYFIFFVFFYRLSAALLLAVFIDNAFDWFLKKHAIKDRGLVCKS
jgi:hypothetical protein